MSVGFLKTLYLKYLLMEFLQTCQKCLRIRGLMPVPVSAAFNISSQTQDCWVFTFLCFLPREIDFVKKEEELKKIVDEKDKWYKQQLENLEHKVRKNNMLELASGVLKTEVAVPFVSTDGAVGVQSICRSPVRPRPASR